MYLSEQEWNGERASYQKEADGCQKRISQLDAILKKTLWRSSVRNNLWRALPGNVCWLWSGVKENERWVLWASKYAWYFYEAEPRCKEICDFAISIIFAFFHEYDYNHLTRIHIFSIINIVHIVNYIFLKESFWQIYLRQ